MLKKITRVVREQLFGPYGVMVAAVMAGNIINYLFAITVARLLGPDDYSALASLIGICMVITVAAVTFQTISAKYVALNRGKGEEENAKYFVWRLLGVMAVAATMVFLVMLALSWPLSSWLKIGAVLPCALLALRTGISFIQPVGNGALQGRERFNLLALVQGVWPIGRFTVGIGLVILGFGLNGAMLGEVAGATIAAALPLLFLRKWLKSRPKDGTFDFGHMFKFVPTAVMAVACMSAVVAVDLILVRAFIGGDQAGYYAGAQRMASMIYFLPGAVATVMFPRVSAQTGQDGKAWKILGQSVLIVVTLCGSVALVFALFPTQFMSLFFGSRYLSGVNLVPILSFAMFSFSLVNLFAYYLLGTDKLAFSYVLGAGVVTEITLISVFHSSITQVAWVVFSVGTALAIVIAVYLLWEWRIGLKRVNGTELYEAGTIIE